MTQDATPRLMSLEEFLARPEEFGELIEGVYCPMTPAPSLRHQIISKRLSTALTNYEELHHTGVALYAPVDVIFEPNMVLQPDLLFMSNEHLDRLKENSIEGPPDVIVEILSPSNPRRDTIEKLALYAKYGVPEYWLVPFEFDRVEVLVLNGDHYAKPAIFQQGETLTSAQLPGFELEVAKLFR
jgi:Uma2 family endonuclease